MWKTVETVLYCDFCVSTGLKPGVNEMASGKALS
jgi:hypothetical protein